jgi:hypothetical protein
MVISHLNGAGSNELSPCEYLFLIHATRAGENPMMEVDETWKQSLSEKLFAERKWKWNVQF